MHIADNGYLSFAASAVDKTRIGNSFDAATIAPLWADLRPNLPGASISSVAELKDKIKVAPLTTVEWVGDEVGCVST